MYTCTYVSMCTKKKVAAKIKIIGPKSSALALHLLYDLESALVGLFQEPGPLLLVPQTQLRL